MKKPKKNLLVSSVMPCLAQAEVDKTNANQLPEIVVYAEQNSGVMV